MAICLKSRIGRHRGACSKRLRHRLLAARANHVRWFDPTVGRWLSEDPSGLGPDSNPYRYCENARGDGTDPSGKAISFPTQADADAFVKALGLTSPTVVQGSGCVLVLANPADRKKLFAYADEHFSEVFKTEVGTDAWKAVAAKRNLFIVNSGVIPSLGDSGVTSEGNGTELVTSDVAQLSPIIKKNATTDTVIDIGGEGRNPEAINININVKTSTTPPKDQNIPSLIVRLGDNAPLDFKNCSVTKVIMQGTPISNATAKEIARVIKKDGTILLENPEVYAKQAHPRVWAAL